MTISPDKSTEKGFTIYPREDAAYTVVNISHPPHPNPPPQPGPPRAGGPVTASSVCVCPYHTAPRLNFTRRWFKLLQGRCTLSQTLCSWYTRKRNDYIGRYNRSTKHLRLTSKMLCVSSGKTKDSKWVAGQENTLNGRAGQTMNVVRRTSEKRENETKQQHNIESNAMCTLEF